MSINNPKNSNYCATVIVIDDCYPLEGLDRLQGTKINGQQILVDLSVKKGDIGLFFPAETALSESFLKHNNLYSNKDKNINPTKTGYFGNTGRVKCIQFVGKYISEGFYIPLDSLYYISVPRLNVGDTFDVFEGVEICKKYVYTNKKNTNNPNKSESKRKIRNKYLDRVNPDHFRLHANTPKLGNNLHNILPSSVIHISYKLHGTSGVASYVKCVNSINKFDKFKLWIYNSIEFLGKLFTTTPFNFAKHVSYNYDYVLSSRTVIMNPHTTKNDEGYYKQNVWKHAFNYIKPKLEKDITMYYEIVGYLPSGAIIQKGYDYGCVPPTTDKYIHNEHFKIFVYRITQNNAMGIPMEYSATQVQEYCLNKGLYPVPELYHGTADNFYEFDASTSTLENWRTSLLNKISNKYFLDKCFMCNNKVVSEGVVVRLDRLGLHAYKVKYPKFLLQETIENDKGLINIEDNA